MLQVDKLKESNNKLREIIDSSWDAIGIINSKSDFIYVNKAFTPVLGYKKEELLKKSFSSIVTNEYHMKLDNLIKSYEDKSFKEKLVVLCNRKDNQKVYLEIILTKMQNSDFFILNAKDVTKELSKDEVIDTYVLSIEINNEAIIKQCSKALCILCNYSQNEIINKNFEIFQSDINSYNKHLGLLKKNIDYSFDLSLNKKDLSTILLKAESKMQFNKYGDIVGFTLLFFDKSFEETLKNKIVLERSKIAIMSETIQTISHEWRQPLNSISLGAQTLDYQLDMFEIDKNSIKDHLKKIKTKVDTLSKTIDNFQDIVSLNSTKQLCYTNDIINSAINMCKDSKSFVDIHIKENFEINQELYTYKNELSTIIFNILTNSKEAFLNKNIKNAKIIINTYAKNSSFYIEIIDNAKGINEKIINKVFQPYFSTKNTRQGVGLGLYMCKTIINMHLKGEISIINYNDGVKVLISLAIKQNK